MRLVPFVVALICINSMAYADDVVHLNDIKSSVEKSLQILQQARDNFSGCKERADSEAVLITWGKAVRAERALLLVVNKWLESGKPTPGLLRLASLQSNDTSTAFRKAVDDCVGKTRKL